MDVTYLGELSIGFSHLVDLAYLRDENNKLIIDSKMIGIKIRPSDKQANMDLYQLTWIVLSFDDNVLKIQLNITNPEVISASLIYD